MSSLDESVGQGEGATLPLAVVFPGEAVDVTSVDRIVMVKPWGARKLLREVPVLLGRILAKLQPVLEAMQGGLDKRELVPAMLQAVGGEIFELVAWSVGLTEEEQERLSAEEFVELAEAVLRQNKSFFVRVSALLEALKSDVVVKS